MSGNSQSILLMIALFVVMYFMFIRPSNKKDKAEREMRNNLQVGDEIMTVGGIYGRVVRIREDRLTIASGAEKTKLEISRSAVSGKVNPNKDAKAAAATEEKKSASPKSIKKLGAKKEAAKETPAAETPAKEETAPEAAKEAAPETEAPKAE